MSCHGQRVRGYISKKLSELFYNMMVPRAMIGCPTAQMYRLAGSKRLYLCPPKRFHTYVANIIGLLLEFRQLLWADDGHLGVLKRENSMECEGMIQKNEK